MAKDDKYNESKQEVEKRNFDKLKEKVNEKAIEYVQSGGSNTHREEIWLLLWDMRTKLFSADKIRKYRNCPPSSLYDSGDEFLTEVFLESIPQVLNSYAKKNAEVSENFTFMQYFNICFLRKICDAYSNIKDNMFHDYIVVQKPVIQVYEKPREDSVIPDIFLKQGMERRILGEESDGKQTWIKTKAKEHGRTVYVRKTDVECHDKAALVDITIAEPEAPDQLDSEIMLSEIYEDYILILLSLAEQLYARNQARNTNSLSKMYCFRLLYTETLIDKLKKICDVIGDIKSAREQEVFSAAEIDLLDYLLISTCRTFSSIAKTPLHARRDFAYLNTENTEEISIPVAGIIYAHFLVDVKGIDRKLDSIAPSLSNYRKEFNQQYSLLCEKGEIGR